MTTVPVSPRRVLHAAVAETSKRQRLGVAPHARLDALRVAATWLLREDEAPHGANATLAVSLDDLALLFPGELG